MRLVMASVPVVLGTAKLLQRLSLAKSAMSIASYLQASTLAAAVLVTVLLSACGSGASTQPATTPESAAPTPDSGAPNEPAAGHSHDPNMLQIVEQACPAGEFHQSCLDEVRGAAIVGLLIAICVWPDGKYAITTPKSGDAAGSTCGEPPGGTIAAIVQT